MEATGPDAFHEKGDQPDPGVAVVEIGVQAARQAVLHGFHGHGPVHEGQVVPFLTHDRPAHRLGGHRGIRGHERNGTADAPTTTVHADRDVARRPALEDQ